MGVELKREGLRPTNFASDVFDGPLLDNLRKDVAEALGRDILIDLTVDFK